jgi:hypothetical protein
MDFPSCRAEQVQYEAPNSSLARSGFSYQSKCFAFEDLEIHIVDGACVPDKGGKEKPPPDRIMFTQVFDL